MDLDETKALTAEELQQNGWNHKLNKSPDNWAVIKVGNQYRLMLNGGEAQTSDASSIDQSVAQILEGLGNE